TKGRRSRAAYVRADGRRRLYFSRPSMFPSPSVQLSILDTRGRGVNGIWRNLAAGAEIRLHRVDGLGLHPRVRDVECDPGAVLFPGRYAGRIAGSSILKRVSLA